MVLEAIKSARRQECSGMEIILVDDGSTDDTIAAVISRFPEVHTIRVHEAGPGPARNAGAAAACGDILMFLDSDDLWLDNHLQQLVNTLNRGFQVAYGVAYTIDEVDGTGFLIPANGAGIEGDCFCALLRWCFLVPSAMAVQKDVFAEIGGFPPAACGEDWIFFLELAAKYPFGFTGPAPITLRRLHRNSLCFLSSKKKLLDITRQMLTVLENQPRATASDYDHFRRLHDWTAAHKREWSTVQEWYLAMQQENMI
jgi:glycosyltransferase involved in cell wall biosynthesis